MFGKILGSSLLAAFALADIVEDTQDSLTFCLAPYSTDLSTGTVWDVSGLDDTYDATLGQFKWSWDYCDTVNGDWYATSTENGVVTGWGSVLPSGFESIKDSEGLISGVSFTYTGGSGAPTVETTRSFTTVINCVEGGELTHVSGPTISTDGWTATVVYSGDAGCPVLSASDTLAWFGANTWAIGILYLIVGPFIAMRGLAMFPYVVATVGSLVTLTAVFLLLASFGCADETAGFWISLTVALAAAIAVGCFVRRAIWVSVGLVSTCAGFYAGALVNALLAAAITGYPAWLCWVFYVLGAVAGFFAGWKLGAPVMLSATAFIGSYLFMRALTCFFWTEYWPSEGDLLSGNLPETVGYQFWVFVGVLVAGTVTSIFVQASHKRHSDLDEYERM